MSAIESSRVAREWLAVEQAVEAFEAAVARDGFADPPNYCPAEEHPLYLKIAVELMRVDMEFAARAGRPKQLWDYRAGFAKVFQHPEALIGAALEEYRLRIQAGDSVAPEEYCHRFGFSLAEWFRAGSFSDEPESIQATGLIEGLPAQARDLARDMGIEAGQFPELGSEVAGFRLVRELGRGAFGRVYLAEQIDLAGRFVALKLSTRHAGEAQTLARLQHTNIVPIYSMHRAGRFHAVSMPFIGSATLADVLKQLRSAGSIPLTADELIGTVANRAAESTLRSSSGPAVDTAMPVGEGRVDSENRGPLDELKRKTHVEAVLWIASELASGLAHAHERGIVHRDLKPANVLLGDDGRPMLLDFNLAHDSHQLDPNSVGGTPAYMSPEQLNCTMGSTTRVDGRSDIYSLGLLLFELLTGRAPHRVANGTLAEQIKRFGEERAKAVPRASRHNPAISPAVDAIVTRCLEPKPSARYQSARDLQEDLLRHLSNRPLLHTPEPSYVERVQKCWRRNPWLKPAPLVGALIVVIACVVAIGIVQRRRETARSIARQQYDEFRDQFETAKWKLTLPRPNDNELAEGIAAGRGALERYGLPESGDWQKNSIVTWLPLDQQNELRRRIGELAALSAGYEQIRAEREARRLAQSPDMSPALNWNDVARHSLQNDTARDSLLWLQRAQLLESADRRDEAIAARNKAGSINADRDDLWLSVAEMNSRREYRKALALFRSREPSHSGTPWYWRSRGLYHAALSEWSDAIAAFTTAISLSDREDTDLLARRGQAHLNAGNLVRAVSDFDGAIRLRPEKPAVYRDRALAKMRQGDSTGALADLDRSLELDPGHTRAHFIKAQIWANCGQAENARREREFGLKAAPSDELSWIARGLAQLPNRPNDAIADFDEALKINPTSAPALQNKASVLSELPKRSEDAIRVLNQLIEAHPEDVQALAGRGVLHARAGRRREAHADAEAALRIDQSSFVQYQVAGLYAQTSKVLPSDRQVALKLLAISLRDPNMLQHLTGDPDLAPLRTELLFQQLVSAAKTIHAAAQIR